MPFDHPAVKLNACPETPGDRVAVQPSGLQRSHANGVERGEQGPDNIPQQRGRLLYIEDNAVNVMLIEELLKSLPGLRLASESTGRAGIARAVAMAPDLILLDLQLPDIDGFEVLRRLRAHPETARTRCIALSAHAMTGDIERGLAAGFDDYWTKPIRFKPFLDALGRLFPPVPQTALAK